MFTARYELNTEKQFRLIFVFNGCAMVQAFRLPPLTTETRLRFHVRSAVYKVALTQVFLRVLLFSLVSIIPLMFYTHLNL